MGEPIKIVCYSEVIDNWGRTESSSKGSILHQVLTTPDDWSDDMFFEDDKGNSYMIDDLIGKKVLIEGVSSFNPETNSMSPLIFTVTEE
jgi:hypothetical protein